MNDDDDYAEAQERFDERGNRQEVLVVRKQFTPYSSIVNELSRRFVYKNIRDRAFHQPSFDRMRNVLPPHAYATDAAQCIPSFFLLHGFNKRQKAAVNVGCWSPDGRRLLCGTNVGEFTLWQGETFKFERIVTTHDTAIRALAWSVNGNMLISGDNKGTIQYFESTMLKVALIDGAHSEAVRGLSFSPSDSKFASCSDDRSVCVWDWEKRAKERVFKEHGWDVRCVAWHPFQSVIVSGSKDNTVKLWDPRCGKALNTLFGHNNTVLAVSWNPMNGNWLATGARDQLIKVYDIRAMREWLTLQGHEREVCSMSWHPMQEALLTSGGFDGSLLHWIVGFQAGGLVSPHTYVANAHNYSVNVIAWHNIGHILATASNDGIVKFWARQPPGSKCEQAQGEWAEALNIRYGPCLSSSKKQPTDKPRDSTAVHSDVVRAPSVNGKALLLRNPLPVVSTKLRMTASSADQTIIHRNAGAKTLLSSPIL